MKRDNGILTSYALTTRPRRNNSGLVLVMVLWVVIVLLAIVATVGRTSRLNTKMAVSRTDDVRCKWACRAGLEKVLAILNEDLQSSDCLSDLWSDNDDELVNVPLERCLLTVRVIDEASKLNVNTITREQLMALPYMEQQIADSIIDWRDQDDTPGADGAEAGYYENLPFRYKIRNGPPRTIRELLMVRGMTEEQFYGEDTNFNGALDRNEMDGKQSPPMDDGDDELDEGWIAFLTCYSYEDNVDAQGTQRVNINQANEQQLVSGLGITNPQARWIVERRQGRQFGSIGDLIEDNSPQRPPQGGDSDQPQPMDLQTFRQIADRITVSGDSQVVGKVNVNTAKEEVLVALLGGTDADRELAQNIIAYREGLLYGMQSIGELLSVSSMSVSKFKAIANFVTVRSNVYTVRCVATANRIGGIGGTTVQTEAVVDRSGTSPTILYWYQGASH